MAVIGKVSAIFTASTSGLTAGVDKAYASLNKMQKGVSSLRGGLNMLTAIQGAQLFGQIASAVGGAVNSMISMGSAQAEVIDTTSKLAARLGFTYGEFAGLAFAGDLAGVSMQTIAGAATKADLAFVKAAGGSKTAIAAFQKIGLSVDQLNGMTAAQRFDTIAASIAALPTEAERAAAAVAIFGKGGAQLLPLFAGGVDGIAQARAEAERFGLTLTNMQGQQVEGMNDAFTRAQMAIQGVIGQIVAYLAPAIEAVTTTFSDFIGSVGGANIGQAIGEALLQGATFFAGIADYVIANLGGVFEYAMAVGQSWAVGWDLGGRVANALYGAFKVFEFVGNTIGGLFFAVISGLYKVAAGIASVIPGFGEQAKAWDQTSKTAFATADNYMQTASANIAQSGAAFGAALDTGTAAAGQNIAGPVSQTLQSAVDKARQAAAQKDTAAKTTLQAKQAAVVDVGPSTAALKATDATSKEGIAEMFRIMRGEGQNDIAERQLEVQERMASGIEQLVGGGEDYTEAALAGF